MDLATETEVDLTTDTTDDAIFPLWTPDDRYLVVNAGEYLGLVATDGSGFRRLESPCFAMDVSPDGRFITCTVEGASIVRFPSTAARRSCCPSMGWAAV